MANLSGQYCTYFGKATEVWKQHVIGVTIVAFDEFRDSVCQTLENVAQTSSRPVPDGSTGDQVVNMEMSRNVQTAIENAQHLALQRIADTLAQTFNAPPPIILSSISNQTIQANQPGVSATSHGGVISNQNDGGNSLDVSIKSEVDSSSESECESDSDDEEMQIKEEPNEEENIISGLNANDNGDNASPQEQTENADNSGDHREDFNFQMGNSNQGSSGQEEPDQCLEVLGLKADHQLAVQPLEAQCLVGLGLTTMKMKAALEKEAVCQEKASQDEAMTIDEELADGSNIEEDPNGPVIIVVQYTSPPSSPLNAEQHDSIAGQQEVLINLNEDIVNGDEADFDAEDDGDGDLGEDEHMDHNDLENQDSDLDGQDESDHEGTIFGEETDGEDDDYSEAQENLSEVENNEEEENKDDSSDETSNEDTEEEEASVDVVEPSTSAQRQGTRRVAKRQAVSGKASKRPRIERNVETVPLRIITKKLKCTVPRCKKMVKSKSAMNRHLLSKHQLKKYRCLVRPCHGKVSTSFSTQSQLNNHHDQVHGSLAEWTCKCDKNFNSYYELSNHYWLYHELGNFTCSKDGCPVKSTTTRAKVHSHQYKHREAKHHCPVNDCGLSFKKKGHLDSHLLTHSGERPFPCPECDKSFTQKGNLTAHLRIHQNDKCFRCTWPQCTYSAIQQSSAIMHIRTAHFKLPRTKVQQAAANIVDDRDARDFLAKN